MEDVRTGQNKKKNVALTQRGKDGGEEGYVPLTSYGALEWLQASWTQQKKILLNMMLKIMQHQGIDV